MIDPSRTDIDEAVAHIRTITAFRPDITLILGSGLGALADSVADPVAIDATTIPHLPSASVAGHKGRFVFGELGGRNVLVIQGRLHMYEGHDPAKIVYPIRIAHALGSSCLFVTNASGGINPQFLPGTLMWITDHINQTGVNPPRTVNTEQANSEQANSEQANSEHTGSHHTGSQQTDTHQSDATDWPERSWSDYYDLDWTERSKRAGEEMGIETQRGTYLWTRGPSYETKAEIRAFRVMGADAVGMSTVPEVIQAKRDGMSVIGLSTITNPAAGMNAEPLNHQEVIETGQKVRVALESLAVAAIQAAPVAGDQID